MANSPKFTITLPQSLLDHYSALAIRDERSISDVIRRTLRTAANIPSDPEEGAKVKTPKLKGL